MLYITNITYISAETVHSASGECWAGIADVGPQFAQLWPDIRAVLCLCSSRFLYKYINKICQDQLKMPHVVFRAQIRSVAYYKAVVYLCTVVLLVRTHCSWIRMNIKYAWDLFCLNKLCACISPPPPRPLGHERVYLPLVADTPFHIQGDDIAASSSSPTAQRLI